MQNCSISIANALEILQYCTKPSICPSEIELWYVRCKFGLIACQCYGIFFNYLLRLLIWMRVTAVKGIHEPGRSLINYCLTHCPWEMIMNYKFSKSYQGYTSWAFLVKLPSDGYVEPHRRLVNIGSWPANGLVPSLVHNALTHCLLVKICRLRNGGHLIQAPRHQLHANM